MKNPQLLTRSAFALIALGLFCVAGQAQTTENGIQYFEAPEAIEARANGEAVTFDLNGKDLKNAILEHAPPAVWLVWPAKSLADSSSKAELTPKIKEILHRFWRAALGYQYYDQLGPTRNVQARIERMMAYGKFHKKLTFELRQEPIETPAGSRLVSHREADSLMMFITLASIELVNQAKIARTDQRIVSRLTILDRAVYKRWNSPSLIPAWRRILRRVPDGTSRVRGTIPSEFLLVS